LKVLQWLSVVSGLTAHIIALMVLVYLLRAITEEPPTSPAADPWFRTVMSTGVGVAICLGWYAIRVRSGSTLTVHRAALTFSLGALLIVIWRSRAGDPALEVVLAALVPTILAASSWWAFRIARRIDSQLPGRRIRPHATRRLSPPRDVRALRAVLPALLGSLMILLALLYSVAAAALTGSIPAGTMAGFTEFGPRASRHFRRVRALLALRAQEARVTDRRLPVLLLRSFADDELPMSRTKALPFAPQFRQHLKVTLSLEEQIVQQLWEIGPVIAIGQPGLDVDPIGAPRERIVGTAWQPRVQALIEESALVVVILGQTEGVLWEYQQLSQRTVPVLAILPPSDVGVLIERWQRFSSAYSPAATVVLDQGLEFPLLVWFRAPHAPLVVSGQPRDERNYELAFALWRQHSSCHDIASGEATN
jgi:hypothetical protein